MIILWDFYGFLPQVLSEKGGFMEIPGSNLPFDGSRGLFSITIIKFPAILSQSRYPGALFQRELDKPTNRFRTKNNLRKPGNKWHTNTNPVNNDTCDTELEL